MGLFDKFKEVTKKVSEVENNIYHEKRDYLEIYERNLELEKEIAETNKQSMMKRYQLYGKKASKLADKSQKNTGKGERK